MFIPGLILFIVVVGLLEKVKTFDLFVAGVKEGIQVVFNLFPTFIGLFLAVNLLRSSGFFDWIANCLGDILDLINFPKELIALAILRPISGSASIAVFTDFIKEYRNDIRISFIAAVIMGSTETTLYALSVYTSEIKKKVSWKLVGLAIAGNMMAVMLGVIVGGMSF